MKQHNHKCDHKLKHEHRHDHKNRHNHNHKHKHKHKEGLGPDGFCVCPKCGERITHQAGIVCQEEKCPKCGAKMLREGSYHYQLFDKKKKGNGKSS